MSSQIISTKYHYKAEHYGKATETQLWSSLLEKKCMTELMISFRNSFQGENEKIGFEKIDEENLALYIIRWLNWFLVAKCLFLEKVKVSIFGEKWDYWYVSKYISEISTNSRKWKTEKPTLAGACCFDVALWFLRVWRDQPTSRRGDDEVKHFPVKKQLFVYFLWFTDCATVPTTSEGFPNCVMFVETQLFLPCFTTKTPIAAHSEPELSVGKHFHCRRRASQNYLMLALWQVCSVQYRQNFIVF